MTTSGLDLTDAGLYLSGDVHGTFAELRRTPGLFWQAGAVSAPLMVKNAVDHGVLQRDRHALLLWLVALLGVGLLEMTAGAVRHLYAVRNRARTDARVRDAIFAHALRLDASYHDRVGPGELMSRASSDSVSR